MITKKIISGQINRNKDYDNISNLNAPLNTRQPDLALEKALEIETIVKYHKINSYHHLNKADNCQKSILILTKPNDKKSAILARNIISYFLDNSDYMSIFVKYIYLDNNLKNNKLFTSGSFSEANFENKTPIALDYWNQGTSHQIDIIFTIGGDGTVLYASSLFDKYSPEVIIPFNTGSMGFLTIFDPKSYRDVIESVLLKTSSSIESAISNRERLLCTVFKLKENRRKCKSMKHSQHLEIDINENSVFDSKHNNFLNLTMFEGSHQHIILNDLVVERGFETNMSLIEIYTNKEYLTTVQADGVTISTPTGSTAYSLSAGGSIVHPGLPAILITPNCPHSLSFRPMVIPNSMVLYLCVPFSSRGSAKVCFDGRNQTKLNKGDFVKIELSNLSLPIASSTLLDDEKDTNTFLKKATESKDWLNSLERCLNWNHRTIQRPDSDTSEGE